MILRNTSRAAAIALGVIVATAGALQANPEPQGPTADNPLESFSRVIGGTWSTADSAHTFAWGLEGRSVTANSYYLQEDGSRVLVGQGFWYWDPEAKIIKGISVSEGMPHDLIEMRSRFEGNTLINELRAIDAEGAAASHAET